MTEPERDPRPEAQREYDSDPELRELMTRAARSPTVRRVRRVDDRADRTAASAARELQHTRSLPKVAGLLDMSEREVLTMTAAGELYSYTPAGDGPRWPAWQFAYGRPLPHLAAVVAAIPAGTHPTGARTVMMTPSPVLMWVLPLDEPIQPLIPEIPRSPATWLVDGGDLEPVLALLAAYSGAI